MICGASERERERKIWKREITSRRSNARWKPSELSHDDNNNYVKISRNEWEYKKKRSELNWAELMRWRHDNDGDKKYDGKRYDNEAKDEGRQGWRRHENVRQQQRNFSDEINYSMQGVAVDLSQHTVHRHRRLSLSRPFHSHINKEFFLSQFFFPAFFCTARTQSVV